MIAIVVIAVAVVGLGNSNDVPSDVVRYDGNGGTYDGKTTMDSKTTEALPYLFEKDGYSMDSWNTKADGSGTKYLKGQTVSFGTLLYAQWTDANYLTGTNLYTDDFNLYVGERGSSEISLLDNQTVKLPTKNAVLVIGTPNSGDVLSVDDNNDVIITNGASKKTLSLSFSGTGLSLGSGQVLTDGYVYFDIVQNATGETYMVNMSFFKL